jgi:hypothetical protein
LWLLNNVSPPISRSKLLKQASNFSFLFQYYYCQYPLVIYQGVKGINPPRTNFVLEICNGWLYHAFAVTVHFKPNPAQLTSKSHKGNVLPVWVRNSVYKHLLLPILMQMIDAFTLLVLSFMLRHKQVAEKRIHKSPSGPNPVGNHNPPSKQWIDRRAC